MSYMKEEWLKREQARAEESLDAKETEAQYQAAYQAEYPGIFTRDISQEEHLKRLKKIKEELEAYDTAPELRQLVPTGTKIADKMVKTFYGESSVAPLLKDQGGSETDKAEGTRDVEKFLKEQQAALWRGE